MKKCHFLPNFTKLLDSCTNWVVKRGWLGKTQKYPRKHRFMTNIVRSGGLKWQEIMKLPTVNSENHCGGWRGEGKLHGNRIITDILWNRRVRSMATHDFPPKNVNVDNWVVSIRFKHHVTRTEAITPLQQRQTISMLATITQSPMYACRTF